jgi:hypothetical protein
VLERTVLLPSAWWPTSTTEGSGDNSSNDFGLPLRPFFSSSPTPPFKGQSCAAAAPPRWRARRFCSAHSALHSDPNADRIDPSSARLRGSAAATLSLTHSLNPAAAQPNRTPDTVICRCTMMVGTVQRVVLTRAHNTLPLPGVTREY